jgi:hypothetical protein
MKILALFGSAAMITAAAVGGSTAIIIGNVGVLAAAGALLMGTVNIEKAPR